jgi:hypothetical protein
MRRLLLSGVVFLFVACGGGPPTSPETAESEGARVAAAGATSPPRRPSTRVVAPRPASENRIAPGAWGGDHVSLAVTGTGGSLDQSSPRTA